jgi:UDPglucose--hexose-1-phosphate uridylyltransferase
MELRKDPITLSWVITGDDAPTLPGEERVCRYCPDSRQPLQVLSSMPPVDGGPWSARAVVHPSPLYRIEGEPQRQGDGIYDKMRAVGAHEVLVENSNHTRQLWNAKDVEIEQFLLLAAQRAVDLMRDRRFNYVSIFKDYGVAAGQDFAHPSSQLVATTYVPRRVLYELRAAHEYFVRKDRCVFCDILAQEERQAIRLVETRGDHIALCPFAPRVPFETWIISRVHDASFERPILSKAGGGLRDLAVLLRRTLNRIRSVSDGFHMVIHTAPNTPQHTGAIGSRQTVDDEYHWHIEIVPIVTSKVKSYTVKEVYFTPVSPETSAARLRSAPAE